MKFEALENDLQSYATKRQLFEIEKSIYKLERALGKLSDIDLVTKEITDIKSDLEGSIMNCVKKVELDIHLK